MCQEDTLEACCSICILLICCILIILGTIYGNLALSDYDQMKDWKTGTALLKEKAIFKPDLTVYGYTSSVEIETIGYQAENEQKFNITIVYPGPPIWLTPTDQNRVKLYIGYLSSLEETPIYYNLEKGIAVTELPSLGLILLILISCYLVIIGCASIFIIGGCYFLGKVLNSYRQQSSERSRSTEMVDTTPSP